MQKVHAMDFKRIYALCSNSTYFKNERINLYSSRKKSLIPFRDGLCIFFFFFKCHRFQRCSYLPSTDGMLSVIIGWFFFFFSFVSTDYVLNLSSEYHLFTKLRYYDSIYKTSFVCIWLRPLHFSIHVNFY